MTTPTAVPPPGSFFTPGRWGRHPAVRVIAMVGGGLVSVVVIGIATVSLANALVRTSETRTRILNGDVERVDVQVTGKVTITPGVEGRARIERHSEFGFRRPRVSLTLRNGVLVVRASCGGLGWCHNDLDISIPPNARVDVSAERVEVRGIDGRVTVDSDGGSVDVSQLSGPVDVRVGGGSVQGSGLTASEVRASAGAGSIELSFRKPPDNVDATAGAGQVVIELPRGATSYRVDADSAAGHRDVTVRTDRRSTHVIRAFAGAGQVTVRYDVR